MIVRRPALASVSLALSGLLLAACGGSDTPAPTQTGAAGNSNPGSAASAAPQTETDSALAAQYKGTLREPAATPRPAAKAKKVAILSAGQASISSSVPVAAAKEAAEAAGWKADVYDVQLNPANAPGLVRQAIASGADGIILQAVDCPGVKGALQEAKAKDIKVVGIYAFDCDDPVFKGNDPALFSGRVNYGPDVTDYGPFTEKYGADQAKAVIAATDGKAKVIFFISPTVTVLNYTGKGFKDELKKCGGCEIVEEVEFAGAAVSAGAGVSLPPHAARSRPDRARETLARAGRRTIKGGLRCR